MAEVAARDLAAWADECRAAGFDPTEVRLVLGRYQAYRRYYESGRRGEPLPIGNWFTFYRMETASEVQQNAPTASGCSVDPNARNRGAIARPREFLVVLLRLAAIEAAA